jgi:hypothetical protein
VSGCIQHSIAIVEEDFQKLPETKLPCVLADKYERSDNLSTLFAVCPRSNWLVSFFPVV